MATVSHGSLAQLGDRMHPFFRSVHGIKPDAEAAVETPLATTMSEMSMTPSHEDGMAHGPPALGCKDKANDPPPSGPKVGGYDGALDGEIDPNLDRRKRRKITPLPQESNETWPQQLEDAANSVDDGNSPETTGEPSSGVQMEQTVASTARRSSRISISTRLDVRKTVTPQLVSDTTSEEPQPVDTDDTRGKHKTTPKKKMLKLTGKGKLIKSPTPSPQAGKPKNATSKGVGQLSLHHGRIGPSMKVVIPYRCDESRRAQTAEKIDRIIEGDLRIPSASQSITIDEVQVQPISKKPTHPFFTGKSVSVNTSKPAPAVDDESSNRASPAPSVAATKQPVPWNEIKFSAKVSHPKDLGTQPSLWPPLSLQHVQPTSSGHHALPRLPQSTRGAKQKQDAVQVPEGEDMFKIYTSTLLNNIIPSHDVQLPERLCLDDGQISQLLEHDPLPDVMSKDSEVALRRIRGRAITSRSAFDLGKAAGPQDWAHSYGPRRADETLQPQALVLHHWLAKHRIHQVQSKLSDKRDQVRTRRAGRKRKAKREDEMDGFIASSDDEEIDTGKGVKNMVILCGPPGSGKTASVYAAAQELDFEVFEINPGMRRNAKDIFDKVGNMAHNHLVQPSAALSRDSSTLTEGLDQSSVSEDLASGKQSTMGSFFGGRRKATERPATPLSERPNLQKQSLILFEEVDILFDEDKSFWAGVQALMQQSKRPIVLTCNSLDPVPLDELNVHATLHFGTLPIPDAVEYLLHVAAAEGHLLSRNDLETLFLGRGRDLRASLMELNFWCQMTVGSKLGGLDWMRDASNDQSKGSRITSKGTYRNGLDLLPEQDLSQEDLLIYTEENFHLSTLDWEESQYPYLGELAESYDRLKGLEDFLQLAETKSCMNIYDTSIRPLVSTVATSAFPYLRRRIRPKDLIKSLLTTPNNSRLSCTDLVDIFEPLMEDFRTFPPTTGRAAASLDGASQTVATEVAPYVRSIVAFDQRLETMRNALSGSSQSAGQRKTRAARAALEGGDKSNTRRERWFPKDLDFVRVLKTCPGWVYENEAGLLVLNIESLPSSQATVSEDGVTVGTPDESVGVMYVGKEATMC